MTWRKLPINISISIQSARDTFGPSQMRNPSDGKCECWLLQQSPRQSVLRNIIHSTFGCIQQKAIWICGFFVYMYTFLSVLVHLFVRDCMCSWLSKKKCQPHYPFWVVLLPPCMACGFADGLNSAMVGVSRSRWIQTFLVVPATERCLNVKNKVNIIVCWFLRGFSIGKTIKFRNAASLHKNSQKQKAHNCKRCSAKMSRMLALLCAIKTRKRTARWAFRRIFSLQMPYRKAVACEIRKELSRTHYTQRLHTVIIERRAPSHTYKNTAAHAHTSQCSK